MLDPEVKEKWLEALRSGKYEQGKHSLCKDSKYCCLGVLADIQGWLEKGPFGGILGIQNVSGWLEYVIIPDRLAESIGLESMGTIIGMNDYKHKSFSEIADWIEENL